MSVVEKIFNVEGMSCSHCERAIKSALTEVNGVLEVSVSLENKHVMVQYEENQAKEIAIKVAIEEAGYEVK